MFTNITLTAFVGGLAVLAAAFCSAAAINFALVPYIKRKLAQKRVVIRRVERR